VQRNVSDKLPVVLCHPSTMGVIGDQETPQIGREVQRVAVNPMDEVSETLQGRQVLLGAIANPHTPIFAPTWQADRPRPS
jgi:hypothetical protein